MSKLVIFDIDGTLTNTYYGDDMCFFNALNEVLDTDVRNLDWQSCPNLTDSAYTDHLFKLAKGRAPSEEELKQVQHTFYRNLEQKRDEAPHMFEAVAGSVDFFKHLKERDDVYLGISTGAWKESGAFKLSNVGIPHHDVPFRGSDDHFTKAGFTQAVIEDSHTHYAIEEWETVYYFGDRGYDVDSSHQLGMEFIGVGTKHRQELENKGVPNIVSDLTDHAPILNWLGLSN